MRCPASRRPVGVETIGTKREKKKKKRKVTYLHEQQKKNITSDVRCGGTGPNYVKSTTAKVIIELNQHLCDNVRIVVSHF